MASNPIPSADHQLTCLGVGEGWPSGTRRHACFLYRFGPTRLMVDCGDGMSSAFKAAGIDYESVDAVFLSHMHSDHVGGFSMFVQSLWLNQRRRPLPVYAPRQALPALRSWLDATLLPAGLVGFDLEWHALQDGVPIQLGPVTVTPHRTSHLDFLRRSFQERSPLTAFEAFSFVLEDAERRVGHTADIGLTDDVDPLLAAKPGLLVSELSHVDLPELAAKLRRQPPSRVVFVHVAGEYLADVEGLEEKLKRELGELPFALARDGDVFHF